MTPDLLTDACRSLWDWCDCFMPDDQLARIREQVTVWWVQRPTRKDHRVLDFLNFNIPTSQLQSKFHSTWNTPYLNLNPLFVGFVVVTNDLVSLYTKSFGNAGRVYQAIKAHGQWHYNTPVPFIQAATLERSTWNTHDLPTPP